MLLSQFRTSNQPSIGTQTLDATVAYQDKTWALLEIENTAIALVLPSQHPPHVAFESMDADKYGDLTLHRDGTASVTFKTRLGTPLSF